MTSFLATKFQITSVYYTKNKHMENEFIKK